MSTPLLATRELRKSFPNGKGDLTVLDSLTFSVRDQSFVNLVGPSGCGKTTLLKILGGLQEPSAGEVLFEGLPLEQPRRRIGFLFQEANLMPWRTALENVRLPLELTSVPEQERQAKARRLLALVGLEGFENAYPRDLSGGMAQRVAIARALATDPELLLLDEPFGSLDALTREHLGVELLRIWEARSVTIVMVTHSIEEAVLLGDRVLVLSPRPAKLLLDLPIDLPRPRSLDLTYTQEFGALAAQVRSAISAS